MSFLNPVNEPVLRFKSTDAGAPQINYNVRTADDVKAVLKACLVTGYGATASAGWTAANEAAHVIEFFSPSAAMSDYRLGIDDTSASNTTWYYQQQDVRKNPSDNTLKKLFNYTDKSSPKNGWQLLVTNRGLYFVELMCHATNADVVARLTFWGSIKSALLSSSGINIGFWSTGYGSPVINPYQFFVKSPKAHYNLSSYTSLYFTAANLEMMGSPTKIYSNSTIDLSNPLYLASADGLAGQQVGLLLKDSATAYTALDAIASIVDTRPVLDIPLNREIAAIATLLDSTRVVQIYLDHWEY